MGQREMKRNLDEVDENYTEEGKSPVVEKGSGVAESRVARYKWNPV